MTSEESKLEILKKVESGTLSIEEGSDLLAMFDRVEDSSPANRSNEPPTAPEPLEKHEASGCWKAAWSMILVGGAILSGFSAYWMYQGYARHGLG